MSYGHDFFCAINPVIWSYFYDIIDMVRSFSTKIFDILWFFAHASNKFSVSSSFQENVSGKYDRILPKIVWCGTKMCFCTFLTVLFRWSEIFVGLTLFTLIYVVRKSTHLIRKSLDLEKCTFFMIFVILKLVRACLIVNIPAKTTVMIRIFRGTNY